MRGLHHYSTKFILTAVVVFFMACTKDHQEEEPPKQFSLVAPEVTGIDFVNRVTDTERANILLYANYYGGAGVGVGDFNNDGLSDLYFAGNMAPDKLYLNEGDLSFVDVTESAGIRDDGGWSTGVTIADVNNDGFDDIYVSRELYDESPELRANLFYINQGDGTFSEEAAAYGIADEGRTRHAVFLDYNKDARLDLFLLTQPPNPGSLSQLAGSDLGLQEYALRLLRNDGGVFTDVTEEAGVGLTGFPNAVSASDLNGDGWTDLYVANDFQAPDFLFLNNQDGSFTNVIDTALNHMSYYSMGIDVADINNDGLLDVSVLDMVAEDNFRLKSNMSGMDRDAFWQVVRDGGHYQYMYNTLQLNNGNGTFSDVAQFAGVAATDWSWSNLLADFDNDGLKDLYVTNGLLRDIRNTDADKNVAAYVNRQRMDWLRKNPSGGELRSIWEIIELDTALAMLPSQPLENYMFKNKGNLGFRKVMEDWGLEQSSFSNGAAYADLDNDGDLDLVVNNINEPAFLYRNNADAMPQRHNYLRIRLTDRDHRPIVGTRTTLYEGTGVQFVETTNVRGIYSTSEHVVHFGLGEGSIIDSLVVEWPDGKRSVQKDVAANALLEMDMSDAVEGHPASNTDANVLFAEATTISNIRFSHRENDFDDYEKQVLLPHKLSQFGPALAAGDVDNNGLQDVFIGGASGQSPVLFLQDASGNYRATASSFWEREKEYEDVDAVFLDVNGDGFDDLYVVSGGNAYPKNDPHYTDRLYINSGDGQFTKGALPGMERVSGSRVIANDYDGDGDTDLFVGGRHLPHNYPFPTNSMLLRNEAGQLVNATGSLAPELVDLGMVTDAEWADYDGDGDTDLLVVGEWMPITFFANEGGQLKKKGVEGLENTSGWWFSVASGDFDEDGDLDFVLGNLGLNYKYKTTLDRPFDIYGDDFDGNGEIDIVLGYYNEGRHYPVRGFSCSSEQLPSLKNKIKKYDLFASLELEEVYGSTSLDNALHYKADTFASVYLENEGDGKFAVRELPFQAQLTNMNDLLVNDFDGDGHLDVLTVGNLFVSEVETPRSDAGSGLLMLGNGDGSFRAKIGRETGFFAQSDAKKLLVTGMGSEVAVLVANNDAPLQTFFWNKKP